ncbi:MAG: cytochrome c family protein [Myxococcales bacterium]|nr:cytochrome c family protein [Myxococcales bacterium]
MSVRSLAIVAAAASLVACGCDAGGEEASTKTVEELRSPETCKQCHPRHYEEWSGSMHAYAAKDPVFLAMNRRGQRETDGALGDFCIKCHAPLAVQAGLTTDGLNLDEVPDEYEGITCYFCHNAVDVVGDHNADVIVANDTTMRGGITDPRTASAHHAQYSELHDRNSPRSSEFCGGCHDIVTPAGVELERTFQEYRESAFATTPGAFDSCVGCHMHADYDLPVADDPDTMVPTRTVHEHLFVGVDVALDDFPHREAQRAAIECDLANGTGIFSIAATPDGQFEVLLETDAGHMQPSGAAQDRRMWLRFIAYDENDQVIYSSGDVASDEVVDKPEGDPQRDPNLCLFRDRLYDEEGEEVHMFWDAASVESHQLPTRTDFNVPHTVACTYRTPALPARVEVALRMRPMGLDVLSDLVDSGDLEPSIVERMPTFTMHGAVMHWSLDEDGFDTVKRIEPFPIDCPDQYRCLLQGGDIDSCTPGG